MIAARTPNRSRVAPTTPTVAADTRVKRPLAKRAAARTGWDAKLRPELAPEVVDDRRRGGRLLLPTPLLVGEAVASIPFGRVSTMTELRVGLARRFQADATCPLMTGIFAAILAGAVADDLGRGRTPRWPIWRLVRDDGSLHPKWPLDARYRATVLRQEGLRLTRRNGNWAVIGTQHC